MITTNEVQQYTTKLYNTLKQYFDLDQTTSSVAIIDNNTGELEWQVKGTLNPQVVKLKTSDQKEESQEDQQEQESSIPSNDQKSLEREQKPKTRKPSRPQFVISYPEGCIRDANGIYTAHSIIAKQMIEALHAGDDLAMPNNWTLQIIYREDSE